MEAHRIIKDEHRNLWRLAITLDQVIEEMQQANKVDPAFITSVLDYFEHFMARHPVCTIDLRHVQIGYNQAVVSGLYTFTFEGSDEKIRARYTYTYRWNGKEWKISSHHSSAMPEKPETNTPLIDARCSQLRAISLT